MAECNNIGERYTRKNVLFLRWRGERYIPKNVFFRKRPADLAFLGRFAREMVCPLTGKLRGRHDDGYGSSRS